MGYAGTDIGDGKNIKKLDPVPYKIPTNFFRSFLLGSKIGNISTGDSLHTNLHQQILPPSSLKPISDTTDNLQELNKEFYLFAGKWKPHMTKHATLDIDTMCQTIIENTASIQELSEKNKSLEEQNTRLQAELKALKEQKEILEKENKERLHAENINDAYNDALIDFMDKHNKQWIDDDTIFRDENDHDKCQIDIIKYFNNWHANKVFMDEWEYNNVMESKDELNEYRIYKKVKGEMVSNGMDNSSVARNVQSIKKSVKDLKK
jgi:hypothetical protein